MDSGQHNGSNVPRMIWIVGTPIVFFVGIVGNIITIVVLSKNRQNGSSTSVYLTVLAVADLLVMTISLPRWWLIYAFGVDIRHFSNGMCKLHWFMTYFDSALSITILVAVTIERIISTIKPYQMKKVCTGKSAVIISSIIIFVLLLFYSHVLFGFSLFHTEIKPYNSSTPNTQILAENTLVITNMTETTSSFVETSQRNCSISQVNNISNCSTKHTENFTAFNEHKTVFNQLVKNCWLQNPHYKNFYNKTFQIVTILCLNIIPEFIFLVGGIIIVRKLTQVKRRVAQEQLGPDGNQYNIRADSNSRQVTVMLLLVNIVFIICTTPVLIFLVKRSSWVDAEQGMTEAQEIVWAIFNLMFYTNHAVNFLLYFLSGKKFRKQVYALLGCKKQSNETNVTRSRATSVL